MKSINEYTKDLTNKLFADNGVFFAFGRDQFEGKKQIGVQYVNLYGRLICPKSNAEKFLQEFDIIYNDAIKKQVEEFGAEKIISYEYFNHETQIAGDVDQVIESLEAHKKLFPELFTTEIILKVCRECFQEAVKNDWF